MRHLEGWRTSRFILPKQQRLWSHYPSVVSNSQPFGPEFDALGHSSTIPLLIEMNVDPKNNKTCAMTCRDSAESLCNVNKTRSALVSRRRRREFFFRTWSEASLAHLKKQTKPNPGAVTRRDQSNQGKKTMAKTSPSKRLLTMYEKRIYFPYTVGSIYVVVRWLIYKGRNFREKTFSYINLRAVKNIQKNIQVLEPFLELVKSFYSEPEVPVCICTKRRSDAKKKSKSHASQNQKPNWWVIKIDKNKIYFTRPLGRAFDAKVRMIALKKRRLNLTDI